MSLPSKKLVQRKFKEALDDKNYDKAAQIAVYYSAAKLFQDPEKFTQGLLAAIEKYEQSKKEGKYK